jgi:O-antigen/teichoic acid export membrane protein
MMGMASLLAGSILIILFRQIYTIPVPLAWPAHIAFACVVLNISIGFFSQLPYGIMAAHHDFVARNLVLSVTALTKLGLIVALVTQRRSLLCLALSQILATLIDATIIWVVVKRRHPQVRLRVGHFQRDIVKQIVSFSLFVLVLNVGAQLSFQTDSLVIGKFLQVDAIPFYAVANSLTTYMIDFVVGIAAVVMPMATRLQVEGKPLELLHVFLRWSKIAYSLSLLGAACLMVLGPRFISLWVGPAFEGPTGTVLRILVFSNLFFLPIRGVALPILMGLGKARRPTMVFLVAGLLNLLMSIAWVRPWGLAGVAWGTAIPNIAF